MATGDILSVTIRSEGWSADVVIEGFTTGAVYAFGIAATTAPALIESAAKFALTVVSSGYNAAGTLGTVTRKVFGTKVVRKPAPNQATLDETGGGNLTVRVALSEYVYTGDTVTATIDAGWCTSGGTPNNAATALAVTNSSTAPYSDAKPIAQWDTFVGVCRADRVKGDFIVAVNAYHRLGMAAVRFTATGQTSAHVQTAVVASQTATRRPASGLFASAYQATIPIAGFTQGELITLRFEALPRVGDATAVLDSNAFTAVTDEAAGYRQSVILCDKNAALDMFAYVDPVAGNDTNGVVSATAATAAATPFRTIGKAVQGKTSVPTIIRLVAGTHAAVGSAPTATRATKQWVVVEPAPGETSATVLVNFDATVRTYKCERLMYRGVRLGNAAATAYPDGENGSNFLSFRDCTVEPTTTAATGSPVGYRSHATYWVNIVGASEKFKLGSVSTSRVAHMIDGARIAGTQSLATNRFVACVRSGASGDVGLTSGNPSIKANKLVMASAWTGFASTTVNAVAHTFATTSGLAIVGCLLEKTSATSAVLALFGDGNAVASKNAVEAACTVTGERCNKDSNDTGAAAVARAQSSVRSCAFRDFTIKTDVNGTPDGNRTGNWATLHGVGMAVNRTEMTTFPPDHGGLNWTAHGDDGIAFVDNKSLTGTGGGAGNYLPAGRSALRVRCRGRLPECRPPVPYDLYGKPFSRHDGNIGALAGASRRSLLVV